MYEHDFDVLKDKDTFFLEKVYIEDQIYQDMANRNTVSSGAYDFQDALEDIGISGVKEFDGSGIKIGSIESGIPSNYINLSGVEYETFGTTQKSHAFETSSIYASNAGIANGASIYFAALSNHSFNECVDWLISKGVNIINRSNGAPTGQYTADSAYADYIVKETKVTFVVSAGNSGNTNKIGKDYSGSRVVVYHGSCKILISSMKLVEEPEDFHGKEKAEVYAAMAQKRIGAEIEFVVKTVDEKEFTAVANRVEAMSIRKDNFYLKKSGIIKEGACAEARIVAVTPFGVWAEIFGVESFINNRELGYQRIHQPSEFFQTGQRVLVKILSVKKDNGKVRVEASIKQAQENPFEKEIWKFAQGSMYLGKVTMVTERGVFVALDGGVECYCKMPTRGRPPRGARATVKIVNIDPVKSRVIGFITHISAKL